MHRRMQIHQCESSRASQDRGTGIAPFCGHTCGEALPVQFLINCSLLRREGSFSGISLRGGMAALTAGVTSSDSLVVVECGVMGTNTLGWAATRAEPLVPVPV